MSDVVIHYRRLPDRVTLFRQRLVHRDPAFIVTHMERTALPAPLVVAGRVILEPDAPATWFTFPGAWHDIGRFHTTAGEFTGWYANILTPVAFRSPAEWDTTDLCLDVWRGADGLVAELDHDEFDRAIEAGWIDPATAAAARAEADRLLRDAAAGLWPPPGVRDWTLDRVRSSPPRGTPADDTV